MEKTTELEWIRKRIEAIDLEIAKLTEVKEDLLVAQDVFMTAELSKREEQA